MQVLLQVHHHTSITNLCVSYQVYYYMGVDVLQESRMVDEVALNRALVSVRPCSVTWGTASQTSTTGCCLLLKDDEQNAADCRALELERPGSRDTTV